MMNVNSRKIKGEILNENNSRKTAYKYDKKIWKVIKKGYYSTYCRGYGCFCISF